MLWIFHSFHSIKALLDVEDVSDHLVCASGEILVDIIQLSPVNLRRILTLLSYLIIPVNKMLFFASQLDFGLDAFLGAEVDALLGGGHASSHGTRDGQHLEYHGQLRNLEADYIYSFKYY